MNKRIEIKSNEYIATQLQDNLVLYTTDLNDELALTAFSPKLKTVGLARTLDSKNLSKFFVEINPDNIKDAALINVRIVGGNISEKSTSSLKQLMLELQKIDNNLDIINIVSCDACDMVHPDSFEIDCYHGGIRTL